MRITPRRAARVSGHRAPRARRATSRRALAGFSSLLLGLTILPAAVLTSAHAAAPAAPIVGNGFTVTSADLAFILKQIKIAERHSRSVQGTQPGQVPNPNSTGDPEYCQSLVGPNADQIPDRLSSYGLRTVDGACNNLFTGKGQFAASDQVFPRLTKPAFRLGEVAPPNFPSNSATAGGRSDYGQLGNVVDSQP